jgi:hypothetical protein
MKMKERDGRTGGRIKAKKNSEENRIRTKNM